MYRVATAFLLLVAIVATIDNPNARAADDKTPDIVPLANDWGLKMSRQIAKAKKGQNVVFYSAVHAQTIATIGLAASGETQKEFSSATGFAGKDDPKLLFALSESLDFGESGPFKIQTAASVWFASGAKAKKSFMNRTTTLFGTEFISLPTSDAAGAVNGWFDRKIGMKDVVNSRTLPDDSRFVIATATKIEGQFQNAFSKDATRKSEFTPEGGKAIKVDMVSGKKTMGHVETKDYSGVAIPVKGGGSLVVVVPTEGKSLQQTMELVTAKTIHELVSSKPKEVRLTMPKVKLNSEANLAEACKGLGIKTAFQKASVKGELSFGNLTSEDVYISSYLQKAELEVDEGGFRGKAAEVATITTRSVDFGPSVTADRPYLMLVVAPNGMLISVAAVYTP